MKRVSYNYTKMLVSADGVRREFLFTLLDSPISFENTHMDSTFPGLTGEMWDLMRSEAEGKALGRHNKMAIDTMSIRYLAMAKNRKGSWSCAGCTGTPGTPVERRDWRLIVPVEVLIDWFGDGSTSPIESQGYYDLLRVNEDSSRGQIKKSYWQLAKQWHPDYCSEPNAEAHFARLSEAYEVLTDPAKKKKYDAVRAWQNQETKGFHYGIDDVASTLRVVNYQPALRCGLIEMEFHLSGKWWIADKILGWSDITNASGQTYVTSWTTHGIQEAWH